MLRRLNVRPWRHWTVRSRMVVVVAALAAVALVATSITGTVLLNNYLISRVDAQLNFARGGPASGSTSRRPSSTC